MVEKSCYKWVMLFLYCFLQWFGGSIWITYASIANRASSYYSESVIVINLFSLSFLIMQLPMAPISSYLFHKSYYWTIMLAYIISIIGVWIRFAAGPIFGLALFGQILVGAMNSMTLSGCSVLAALWFDEAQRPIAVAVASTSPLLGSAFGLVISPYYDSIEHLLLTQACYATLAGILNLFLSRNKKDIVHIEGSYKIELKIAFEDKFMLALIVLISAALGIAYALTGIIYQLLDPFGITESQSGWIGFSMYIGGMIGGILTSLVVLKTKNFINPMRIFAIISVTGCIAWSAVLGDIYSDIIGSSITGFGLFGLMPLGIQAVVDQNKHVAESITTNLVYLIAQGLSVVYTYPLIYCYRATTVSGMWLACFLCILVMGILLIIYRSSLIEKHREINDSFAISLKSVLVPGDNMLQEIK